MLEVGDEAPSFTLTNQDGEDVSLADYAGRHVVVYFYPRADTPGCTTEACEFRDLWKQYEARDIAVLAISDDPVGDLQDFAEKYDLPIELLSDESGAVAAAYDSYGEKNMFGKTFDGVFRNTYLVGPDGTVVDVYRNVTPEGHAATVLKALD
ncbi:MULTISPECIES: thioredoxin-dependent thiol peroxidase [unclassified Haladaptatus]|uniref:thioredoxin-dependent thiol peroxidase n=1 Tax=unclassified Haladaptatus TaxID=2622732 RepID=UPI0023E7DCE5|nr:MULTISPECIES: thioredoxin-dependent thiol peroxidase [unclassified Haladaptatus]